MESNILRPLAAWTSRMPDEPAVECEGQVLTWRELDRRAGTAAARLIGQGIGAGDRVAVVGRPSLTWAAAAIGILRVGAVVCPLNERNSATELGEALARLEVAAIVTSAACRANLEAAAPATTVLDLEDVAADGGPQAPPIGTARETDAVCILSTSGSTGLPKGVVYTHRTLSAAFFEWCLQEPGFLRARSLNVSSMSFAAGLLNGFLGPLVLGGSVVFLPEWEPRAALALIRDKKINQLGATTIFYEQMAAVPEFAEADLSSLTVAFTGGNPVTANLIRSWSDKGVGLRQVYGMTESQSNVSVPSVQASMDNPDCVGRGGVTSEIRVVAPDGTPCPTGERGEVVISGPGLAAGYWNDPALTSEYFTPDGFHTGDVGQWEPDGSLRIVGRTKDVIISGGINIYAAELERAIMELPGVLEVAVIGVPDVEFGESPAVLIRGTDHVGPEAVVEHCRMRLARYKSPRYVEMLAEPLPRTAGMKVDKAALRRQFGSLPDWGTRLGGTVPRPAVGE
ncbi:class I adenylate-forming enzyme family protein [Rhodococcus sp. NPDC003348]